MKVKRGFRRLHGDGWGRTYVTYRFDEHSNYNKGVK